MKEELTITFYKIHKCGYYIDNKNQFGNLAKALVDLGSWVKTTPQFIDTALFDPDTDQDVLASLRKTYFYKQVQKNQNLLLVLWNELPDVKGEVATLSKEKKTDDDTECKITTLPEDSIPGTASYFWFLPEIGYYATICKKNRGSNNDEMKLYLQRFLAIKSSFCVTEQVDGEIRIMGYKKEDDEDLNPETAPLFQSSRASRKGQIEYITENRTRIRKIVRKQGIDSNTPVRLPFMKKILKYFGIKNPVIPKDKINTYYEVSYTPTEVQLTELIEAWKANDLTDYDDTGFVFHGDAGKMHWLSGEISRVKKEFDVAYHDKEVIEPLDLLTKLNENKSELIGVLDL